MRYPRVPFRMVLFASVFVSLLAACRPVVTTPQVTQTSPDAVSGGLGANDTFEVRVYGDDELSGDYRVHPDGTIDFPFVGTVDVRGMSPSALSDHLANALREGGYLVDPQVSVVVEDYNSQQVTVIGEVRRPGSFPMRPGLTVVQAVSLAGGFTSIAQEDGTTVTRTVDGETRRFQIPAGAAARGRAEDFALQPGDIVNVPRSVI